MHIILLLLVHLLFLQSSLSLFVVFAVPSVLRLSPSTFDRRPSFSAPAFSYTVASRPGLTATPRDPKTNPVCRISVQRLAFFLFISSLHHTTLYLTSDCASADSNIVKNGPQTVVAN